MSDDDRSSEISDYKDSVSELEYGSDDEDETCLLQARDKPSVKVITRESLLAAQCEDLKKVAEMLGIKQQHARTLLIHHRWDLERVFGMLAEKGKEQLFLEAGLPPEVSAASFSRLHHSSNSMICETCFDEVPQELASKMDCGHSFCNDCWTHHFLLRIREGQSRRIKCMAHNCNAICDEDTITKLVHATDQAAGDKFEQSLLESYIEDNSKVKWCPSVPHCGNAILVEGEPYCEIECICGQQLCFNCTSEAHSPCSCLMWQLWDKKCKDESETVNWLTVHTKSCPKCHKPVEKNGGCNLVGCVCGQAFCWLCGTATGREHTWTRIEGHSCGRYKEDREREAVRAEHDLKRYIHYHSRWQGHNDSLKLEAKQREVVQEKIAKLEASESSVKDFSWLTDGLHGLFRARRALSYSYAFAFFMFGKDLFKDEITAEQNEINQNLFEDQQQQLEGTVERLSKAIETRFELNIDDSQLAEIRLHVINLSGLTDSLCRNMYECIENDLLGTLQLTTHHIAKYDSNGVYKAVEITQDQQSTGMPDIGRGSSKPVQTPAMGLRSLDEESLQSQQAPLLSSQLDKDSVEVGDQSEQMDYQKYSQWPERCLGEASNLPSARKRPRHNIDLNLPLEDVCVPSWTLDPLSGGDNARDSIPNTSSPLLRDPVMIEEEKASQTVDSSARNTGRVHHGQGVGSNRECWKSQPVGGKNETSNLMQ